MGVLGPDPDRDDAAQVRLLARVLGDRTYYNRHDGGHYFAGRHPGELLSERQKEVLTCASHGLGALETAEALGVTEGTVLGHLANARALLRAKNTEHAVANAIRRGLIR